MAKTKVLIIGLDGATWNVLVGDLLDKYMPTLKKLMDTGRWGILRSTSPAITPAAWTSCITGCSPDIHGIAGFRKYCFESNSISIGSAADCRVPNIFQQLSEQGFSVAAINVPWTYPCVKINGIIVAGHGSPGIFTYPENFKKELLAQIPDYDILPEFDKPPYDSIEQLDSKMALVEKYLDNRLEAATLVIRKVNWDLMMVVFQSVDKLGHFMWPYLDVNTRNDHPKERDRLYEVFARLDKTIKGLLELSNTDDLLVAVVSDHGMGPKFVEVFPNAYLHQWGYLKFQNPLRRIFRRVRRNIWSQMGQKKKRMSIEMKMPVDWARTKAILIHADINGHLFLNVKGRQQEGTVNPGAEYETILEDLKNRLTGLRCSDTGRMLFEKIVRPEQLYNREDVDKERFGDLVLVPAPGCLIQQRLSSKVPRSRRPASEIIEGTHYPEGIYVLSGRNIIPGRTHTDIINIAPTIYAALGAELPDYVDGAVMKEAFKVVPEIRFARSENTYSKLRETFAHSSDDEKQIERRLADLGYLG